MTDNADFVTALHCVRDFEFNRIKGDSLTYDMECIELTAPKVEEQFKDWHKESCISPIVYAPRGYEEWRGDLGYVVDAAVYFQNIYRTLDSDAASTVKDRLKFLHVLDLKAEEGNDTFLDKVLDDEELKKQVIHDCKVVSRFFFWLAAYGIHYHNVEDFRAYSTSYEDAEDRTLRRREEKMRELYFRMRMSARSFFGAQEEYMLSRSSST